MITFKPKGHYLNTDFTSLAQLFIAITAIGITVLTAVVLIRGSWIKER